jgi:hypothetical protein
MLSTFDPPPRLVAVCHRMTTRTQRREVSWIVEQINAAVVWRDVVDDGSYPPALLTERMRHEVSRPQIAPSLGVVQLVMGRPFRLVVSSVFLSSVSLAESAAIRCHLCTSWLATWSWWFVWHPSIPISGRCVDGAISSAGGGTIGGSIYASTHRSSRGVGCR